MKVIAFLIFIGIIHPIQSIFCSAYCKPNSCTGQLKTQCTDCDPPFILQNSTCVIDTSSNYALVAQQSTITAQITPSGLTLTTCGAYTFYGGLNFNDNVRLQIASPITYPHYSLRVIAWIILYDQWNTALDFVQLAEIVSSQLVKQPVSTYSTAQLQCSWSTSNQWYLKLDIQILHSSTTTTPVAVISTSDVETSPWGIKQYMFLAGKCHTACLVCLDATPYNCTQCATGYKLSGTICNQTCIYKYGETASTSICVACDIYCVECYQISTNCSVCQNNGTYESFLSGTSCLVNCPTGTTKNTTSHICIPCSNINCTTCQINNPINCTACLVPASFWFNFDCITQCPNGYYANSPNCTICNASCQICTGSPSPCSKCSPGFYLDVNVCVNPCPSGFFPLQITRTCLDCSLYCIKASILMGLSVDNSKLIIQITFTGMIDFSIFPMQNFQSISVNDSQVSLQRFKITYEAVSQYSYKIELTPKMTMNLSNANFTVTINPKSQQYYSMDPYPFDISVFTLQAWQVWNLIVYPSMNQDEKQFINKIQQFNNILNFGLGQQFSQQIKKTGIFALLFPGAQLCSTVVLHNSIPAQNFYQAARFWASFIYFEVPKWEEGPNLTKYIISPTVQSLMIKDVGQNRLLQTASSISSSSTENWRFSRTGFSHLFIFDTYFILAILIASWLIVLIIFLLKDRIPANRHSIAYNLLHKLHQMGLFYISLSIALQWLTFSNKLQYNGINTSYMYASFGLSIFSTIYFLTYQVYVFYKLIPYGVTIASSKQFSVYVEKYSYFLRDLRYQQYDTQKGKFEWTPRHFLRPYNYQVLSCLRLVLLVVAMPIFHSYPLICGSCMITIQSLQILRFCLTWPYGSKWRNALKLAIQIVLLLIFILYFIASLTVDYIYLNLNTVTQSNIRGYYVLGWFGFVFIFIYNIAFVVLFVIDIVIGCRFTNRERMQNSRQQYYYQILSQYENYIQTKNTKKKNQSKTKLLAKLQNNKKTKKYKYQYKQKFRRLQQQKLKQQQKQKQKQEMDAVQQSPLSDSQTLIKKSEFISFVESLHGATTQNDLDQFYNLDARGRRKTMEKLIEKGNLHNKNEDGFKKIEVIIQQYQVKYAYTQNSYQVQILRIPGVFMRPKKILQVKNNTLVPQRNTKTITLNERLNLQYYRLIHNLFTVFASISTETVILRTYLKIDQNLYSPGQEIPQIKDNLRQSIQVRDYNGSTSRERLQDIIQGFPVPNQLIQIL